ncbi:hypothetical protein [Cellvibrio mixtus]|uniref:hypothetical protein n=1 Tax=Cellvibrio mixtus TaxID=39650 RepID=UPI0005867BDD|nr:hypothetical protein [Cellvibrio mixtus]
MSSLNEKASALSNRHTFKIGGIYWLATLIHHWDDTDDLTDCIGDLYTDHDQIAEAIGCKGSSDDEILNHLLINQLTGLLIKVETPVMECIGYSWNHYSYTWIYAESLEDALEAAKNWVTNPRPQ